MPRVLVETAVITIATDNDLSAEVDFGEPVRILWVDVPTIDSSTVDVQSASAIGSETPTTYLVAAADILGGAGTGGARAMLEANEVIGFRHYKIATSGAQLANRTFTIGAITL